MASGLAAVGVASSLLDLAKVGIELSKLINQFVEAKPRLKALIQEIKLGASVLELLGGVFKQEEKDQICSANALDVANNIARAYQTVFDELKKKLSPSLRAAKMATPKSPLGRL